MQVLRDALVELRNNYEEYEAKEMETLQINLAFLPGVTRTTVEVLANLIQNNDPLLLVLGSMARYADEVSKIVAPAKSVHFMQLSIIL